MVMWFEFFFVKCYECGRDEGYELFCVVSYVFGNRSGSFLSEKKRNGNVFEVYFCYYFVDI